MSKNAPMFNGFNDSTDIQTVTGSVNYTFGNAPNGKKGVKCTFTGSVAVKFTKATGNFFNGDAVLSMSGGKAHGLESITFRVYQTFASNTQKFKQYVFQDEPLNNFKEQGGVISLFNCNLSWGVSGSPAASYNIDDLRLTMVSKSGETAEVWLFGYSTVFNKRKSKICVTFDDGYTSLFTHGAAVFSSRGIPMTLGVIPSAIDEKLLGYASLEQLQSFVAAGNCIVPHYVGDLIGTTSPEIFRQYASSVVNWIVKNDLQTTDFEKCYIWPQAKFQNKSLQTDYLESAIAAGVSVGRGANPVNATQQQNIDSLSKFGRLTMPVIGHSWAGSTASEVTNINNIVSYINSVADNGGLDVFIVLHKVVDDSTPDGNMSLSIRVSGLNTIATAIKTKIDAGLLEAVTMNNLAADSSNPWNI